MSKDTLVFDIETDGLLDDVTKIHCIALKIGGTEELYSGSQIPIALEKIQRWKGLVIGHNICSFDLPALKKLVPNFKLHSEATIIDTLLLGCILDPEAGILSLENWGEKLGIEQKVQHEDWSVYTHGMGRRCQSDCRINEKAFQHLANKEHYALVAEALNLEQQVALIHASQSQYGVKFDIPKAIAFMKQLDKEKAQVEERVVKAGPWKGIIPAVAKKRQEEYRSETHDGIWPWRKDGAYTKVTERWFEGTKLPEGAYNKVTFEPFNPNNDEEVREVLLGLGWRPTEWNTVRDKMTGEVRVTSPKLTEDSFHTLPEGLGQDIALFNTLSHRRSWLLGKKKTSGALTKIRSDGRISSQAFTCGTNTSRYRHQGAVCNIPRVTTKYGREMRELFCVPKGRKQVGVDLSGIEARMLAHFLLNGNYTKAKETAALILSPDKKNDFHSFNAKQWGVSRDIAKNTLYALMYGAGNKKLAITAGKPESYGAKLKRDFYKAHPGIKELIADLETAYDRKRWIKGIDGRPLYIRQKNRLLNTLLQNAATIVFKRWMVELAQWSMRSEVKGKVSQIIAYHDELQFECSPEIAAQWADVCEGAAERIGRKMKLKIPIAAEGKIGMNWGDCH